MKKLAYIVIVLSILSCDGLFSPTIPIGGKYTLSASEYADLVFVFGSSFANEVKDKFYWGNIDNAMGRYYWNYGTILLSDRYTQDQLDHMSVATHEAMHYWQDKKLGMTHVAGGSYFYDMSELRANTLDIEQTAVLVTDIARNRTTIWNGTKTNTLLVNTTYSKAVWYLYKRVLEKNKITGYTTPKF